MSLLTNSLTSLLPANLSEIAFNKAAEYQQANPFPHIVLDNFLAPQIAQFLFDSFPSPTDPQWQSFKMDELHNKDVIGLEHLDANWQQIIQVFSSPPMLRFLEQLTGIKGLIADPYQIGRGLQQTHAGGFLSVHTDDPYHNFLNLERRVNLLLYLTPNWEEEWGGQLELWNKDMTQCVKAVAPLFNRCLLFTITPHSNHGYPQQLTCPPDMPRRLLSLIYCTGATEIDISSYSVGAKWQKISAQPLPDNATLPTHYQNLSGEELKGVLLSREWDLRNALRERESMRMRLGEAHFSQQTLRDNERNWLLHRVAGAEQRARELEQEICQLNQTIEQERLAQQAQMHRLTLELGAAQQWGRELENRLKQQNTRNWRKRFLRK